MTSEGYQDYYPTSPPAQPAQTFPSGPPPDPPAPYGYPPATGERDERGDHRDRGDTVPPAPGKVRATASVPVSPPTPPGSDQTPPVAPLDPPAAAPAPPEPATPPVPMHAPQPAHTPQPPPIPPASYAPPPPPPTREPAEGTDAAGHGPAGVAAVPTANRATPVAGEAPGFAAQPRVYQTAAGPPQPLHPPLPTRTPGEPADPPLPTRTPAEPADPPRPPRQRQPTVPVYSDLLGPAPAEAPPAGSPHPYQPIPDPPPYQPAAGPDAPHQPPGPADPPAPSTALYIPQQRPDAPPQQRPDAPPQQPPATGAGPPAPAPAPAPDDDGKSGPSVGVIVGLVLIGATVLVLGALSIPFLLDQLRSDSFSVGDCVVQAGENPEPAECSAPDAYEIVSQVDSLDECEDPTQPYIRTTGSPEQYYCLAPAGGEPEPESGEPGNGEPGGGD